MCIMNGVIILACYGALCMMGFIGEAVVNFWDSFKNRRAEQY